MIDIIMENPVDKVVNFVVATLRTEGFYSSLELGQTVQTALNQDVNFMRAAVSKCLDNKTPVMYVDALETTATKLNTMLEEKGGSAKKITTGDLNRAMNKIIETEKLRTTSAAGPGRGLGWSS